MTLINAQQAKDADTPTRHAITLQKLGFVNKCKLKHIEEAETASCWHNVKQLYYAAAWMNSSDWILLRIGSENIGASREYSRTRTTSIKCGRIILLMKLWSKSCCTRQMYVKKWLWCHSMSSIECRSLNWKVIGQMGMGIYICRATTRYCGDCHAVWTRWNQMEAGLRIVQSALEQNVMEVWAATTQPLEE
jgi:hypothetical protein